MKFATSVPSAFYVNSPTLFPEVYISYLNPNCDIFITRHHILNQDSLRATLKGMLC